MLCSSVTLALGILTGWHCRLISYGETSIEWHSNRDEAKRLRKKGLVSNKLHQLKIQYAFRECVIVQAPLSLLHSRFWCRHAPKNGCVAD